MTKGITFFGIGVVVGVLIATFALRSDSREREEEATDQLTDTVRSRLSELEVRSNGFAASRN